MLIELNRPHIKSEWLNGIESFLKEYNYDHDTITKKFEAKVCEYTNSRYSLAVSNGTSALLMILMALKDGNQNEIISQNWGHPALYKCCKHLGFDLVPVEMNLKTLTMDEQELERSVTNQTRAIVHIENNGILGNIETLSDIAKSKGVPFIEDAAPSLIQKYKGTNAGTIGEVGFYSFSPTKPMTSGEGAVIVTNSSHMYEKLKTIRYNPDYINLTTSLNFNLSPFLMAYLMEQFDSLSEIATNREWAHRTYQKYGLDIYEHESVTNRYPYAMYLSNWAPLISSKLNKFSIGHRYGYYPVYDQSLRVSGEIQSSIIDLPCAHLSEDQIKTICTLIKGVENDSI